MMQTSATERATMMNPGTLLSASQWAEYTVDSVLLGDQLRTERAIEMARAIAHDPAASSPCLRRCRISTSIACETVYGG
jgi:hypothetical protein